MGLAVAPFLKLVSLLSGCFVQCLNEIVSEEATLDLVGSPDTKTKLKLK